MSPAPLTTVQEQTLKDTLNNAKNVLGASKSNSSQSQSQSQSGSPSQTQSELRSRSEDISARIENSISSGDCTSSMGSQDSINFKLSGDKCPVIMSFDIEQKDSSFNLDVSYKIQDPNLFSANDVTEYSVKTSGSVNFSKSSSENSFENTSWNASGNTSGNTPENTSGNTSGSSLQVDLKIKGKLHSQKSGDISFDGYAQGNESQDSVEGKASLTFTFPNFTAELRMEKKDKEQKYYLNGKEKTQEEAAQYFDMMMSGK